MPCGFKKSRFEQKKYEEIADELKISVNTVKYHIKKCFSIHSITYGRLSETADIVYVLGKLKKIHFRLPSFFSILSY